MSHQMYCKFIFFSLPRPLSSPSELQSVPLPSPPNSDRCRIVVRILIGPHLRG
ncbi:hypothetical protein I3843_Q060800 [Carya illinoinensis]|nr:hypothetical protein I3843_Q060800 [Carya illinoinensis]KAG6670487.1 hypothetical protein I3843_Q060800 [Carya illinoinensis]